MAIAHCWRERPSAHTGPDGVAAAAAATTLCDIVSLWWGTTGVLHPKMGLLVGFLGPVRLVQTETLFTKRWKAILGERLIWMSPRRQHQHFPDFCLQQRSSIHPEDVWIIPTNCNAFAALKGCVSSELRSAAGAAAAISRHSEGHMTGMEKPGKSSQETWEQVAAPAIRQITSPGWVQAMGVIPPQSPLGRVGCFQNVIFPSDQRDVAHRIRAFAEAAI